MNRSGSYHYPSACVCANDVHTFPLVSASRQVLTQSVPPGTCTAAPVGFALVLCSNHPQLNLSLKPTHAPVGRSTDLVVLAGWSAYYERVSGRVPVRVPPVAGQYS
jgi:hypothetical protein